MTASLSLSFKDNSILPVLYGERNANLSLIEKFLKVEISTRGHYLLITGESDSVVVTSDLLEILYTRIEKGCTFISVEEIKKIIKEINSNLIKEKSDSVEHIKNVIQTRKKNVFAYTDAQHKYIKTLYEKEIVFSIGAAGTGKTYLAVAAAVNMFIEKKVSKIILTRPAVEAGEKIGFLPGDIKDKVDPYLQPLYDALYDMLPAENVERYLATREIQIAPLAFMRGRTLSNAFVIMDEAQNATKIQMKMFLTRLGQGSRMAITGDLSQVDLPHPNQSGLIDAIERLKEHSEIGIVRFNSQDVVRHPLTAKIIDAYEENHNLD
jgi:phosphate starvation-inducible PhoH-like protein